MKRRQFFSFLAKSASITSLAASGALLAQPATKPTQLEVLNTQINGLYYYDIEQISQQLEKGKRYGLNLSLIITTTIMQLKFTGKHTNWVTFLR